MRGDVDRSGPNGSIAAGVLLLAAVIVALVWFNSPWRAGYESLWSSELGSQLGSSVDLRHDLRFWVNEGLMALFFLVVGLEIKREIVAGELRRIRVAALPVFAAIGGMVIPALLYLAIAGGERSRGWGIPMATDIAFALGALTLAGRSAPASLRPLLLTLAIVDDMGAILVIALFYSEGIQLVPIAVAVGGVALATAAVRVSDRAWPLTVVLGVVAWYATYEAGIHPAIAGVMLGLAIPAASVSRLERALVPVTSFVILPIFALANAGVELSGESLRDASTSAVALGIFVGLVVGKPLGVLLGALVGVRTRAVSLAEGMGWSDLAGMGLIAGIGFTVALFVAELAFPHGETLQEAKIAILAASITAGLAGSVVLRLRSRR